MCQTRQGHGSFPWLGPNATRMVFEPTGPYHCRLRAGPRPRQACPSSRSTRARRAVSPRPPASSRRQIAWTPRSSPAWERCSSSIRARPPPGRKRQPQAASPCPPSPYQGSHGREEQSEKPRPHDLETPERRAPRTTSNARSPSVEAEIERRITSRSGAIAALRHPRLHSRPRTPHRLHLADRNARTRGA